MARRPAGGGVQRGSAGIVGGQREGDRKRDERDSDCGEQRARTRRARLHRFPPQRRLRARGKPREIVEDAGKFLDQRSDYRKELDRKRVGSGKSVSVRVDLGGGGIIQKKKKKKIDDT